MLAVRKAGHLNLSYGEYNSSVKLVAKLLSIGDVF